MELTTIKLTRFKNYLQRQFRFDHKVTGITGNNGAGKTNLLDAIYYLCFTKSYFHFRESQNVTHGHDGFRLDGTFLKNGTLETVTCIFRNSQKEVKLNEEAYNRFSQHIGQFPAVFIAPDDAILISGGSEPRRRFMDMLLAQINPAYLDHLIAYQKILGQRNELLKNAAAQSAFPSALLETYDEQLASHGGFIFKKRKEFLSAFTENVQQYYGKITGNKETTSLQYESVLHQDDFLQLLQHNRRRDILLQRTSEGIHRDDLFFLMNDHPLKQTGSQGQRKSFLFALKLAQYETLRSFKGFPPLLLLDDIFEKLDHDRITRLIGVISQPDFGQVFITDTEEERLKKAFAQNFDQLQMIHL